MIWNTILMIAMAAAMYPGRSKSAAPTCAPTPALIEKLRTQYTKLNRVTWKEEHLIEHFSMVNAGTLTFVRHNNDPNEERHHPVSVYEGAEEIGSVICADDEDWVDCALNAQPYHYREDSIYRYQKGSIVTRASGPPCDFDIRLPEWKPSPDTLGKRRIAAAVLQQFTFGKTDDLKSAYVRDFNLSDTGLDIYFLYKNGQVMVQGCDFNANDNPPCTSHLYGQAPLQPIIQHIMERPYRLYPPPMGKR